MITGKHIHYLPAIFLILLMSLNRDPCYGAESASLYEKKSKWEEIAKSAGKLGNTVNKNADYLENYINDDEETLKVHLNNLRKKLEDNTARLAKLRSDLEVKISIHEKLDRDFENASSDMKTLEGTVRGAARQCIEQFKLSPVSFTGKDRFKLIETFLSGKMFPSIDVISAISQVLFEEIEQTGTASSVTGDFIGLTGKVQSGTIIRAGGFFLGFNDGKNTGFLSPQEPLPVARQGLSQSYSKDIESWFKGSSILLCMDITDGAALEAQARKQGFSQWFEAGGLLLWPISAVAFTGLFVILYKTCFLFTQRRLSGDVFSSMKKYIQDNDRVKSMDMLQKITRTPAASVLLGVLKSCNANLDALDNSLHEKSLIVVAGLERMLPLLGVLGAIAPLLGLLGTVTGMISTFQTITIFGTGDPRMLSTGISEALITTEAGLTVSIPFLLVHHLLKRRVNTLMNDVEENNAGFAAFMSDIYSAKEITK